ncbi:MAG: DUF2188 domain-containing protein [Bacillota bacterium]|nr:DUF2188 domain-containing protein [Bacillota bacterium]
MNKKAIHTVPNAKGGWDNKRQGSDRTVSHADTKIEAVKSGREQAIKDNTEHIIHNKNGQFGARNSYGNDPFPPRG